MASYVRGSNPVWLLDDLTGNLFDDTFYLYVLQNTIPYNAATVYHDPDGNVAWSSPIQFLANGTLPVDIFFTEGETYRLEFRKNDGTAPPSQADALIYLVEDYKPGSGGSGPITSASLTSDNQITNPQFSLISFETSLEISSAGTYEVAPGWELVLTGNGTATVTREELNNTSTNPTNAPYALRMDITGWTTRYLRQRFNQNGMLWAGLHISTSLTAKIDSATASVSATLVDSNGTDLGTVLPLTPLTASYDEYTFVTPNTLPDSSNPDVPPSAYIEYRLDLPAAIDIYLSSIQVVASSANLEYSYEQDTIDRQIDHAYHLAYPIVPVGSIIDYCGFEIPDHYINCNGDAYNRVTYSQLFNALTFRETVALTDTVSTFTVLSSDDLYIGMAIEGDGIQTSTTISGIAGTTITMSNPADDTGNFEVRFFAVGAGDGSTTFNVPDLQDYVTAGVGGSLFGSTNNGIGKRGGSATHSITANELPAHTHAVATGAASGAGGATRLSSGTGAGTTGDNTTSHTAMTIVQQTALMRKLIRYE